MKRFEYSREKHMNQRKWENLHKKMKNYSSFDLELDHRAADAYFSAMTAFERNKGRNDGHMGMPSWKKCLKNAKRIANQNKLEMLSKKKTSSPEA